MNQRGFMLLSAVFLTVIVSFTAMMTLQAITQVQRDDASLRLTAINWANEKFALIESAAQFGNVEEFDGKTYEMESYGLYDKNDEEHKIKAPIKLELQSRIVDKNGNLIKFEIEITRKDGKPFENMKFYKTVKGFQN